MISLLIMSIILLIAGLWTWRYLYKQWKKAELEEEEEAIDDVLKKVKITEENYKKVLHMNPEKLERAKVKVRKALNLYNEQRNRGENNRNAGVVE